MAKEAKVTRADKGRKRLVLNRQTKRLNDETRFQLVRDLEHHCRLWVNAYVMQLTHNRTMRLSIDRAREWQRIKGLMFCVLVQEGNVEKAEENDKD